MRRSSAGSPAEERHSNRIDYLSCASSRAVKKAEPQTTRHNFFQAEIFGAEIAAMAKTFFGCQNTALPAALEGAALAVKNGIDPAMAARILNAGSARNYYSERTSGERIIHGKVEVGFSLALMLKDVKLACRLGSDSGMPMFYGGLTKELYQLCLAEMGANADVDSATLVIDRLCKTNILPSVT